MRELVKDTHHDDRGSIYFCELEGRRFNILFSKAGSYRSGDVHEVGQFDLVIDGVAEIKMKFPGSPQEGFVLKRLEGSERYTIPAGVPHLFFFPEDTVMLEHWNGEEFDATFYKPFRDIVERQGEG